jgi:hypothetical protein
MATLTLLKPNSADVSVASGTAASAGGDEVANDGRVILRFKNASGSPITVTVTAQKLAGVSWITYNSKTISVAATTGDVIRSGFPKAIYDNVNQRLAITYSAVTSLTVWAMSAADE